MVRGKAKANFDDKFSQRFIQQLFRNIGNNMGHSCPRFVLRLYTSSVSINKAVYKSQKLHQLYKSIILGKTYLFYKLLLTNQIRSVDLVNEILVTKDALGKSSLISGSK